MNADSFWKEEHDLPSDAGFKLFEFEHIMALIIILFCLILAIILFRKLKAESRIVILRIVAVILPVLELWKIIMLITCNRMSVGHLPLHLCSMTIFVYPVIAFMYEGRLRETLAEISVITLLPAAISALVFPDWNMYPIINFYSLHAFVWHSLQVLFPILCIINGWVVPKVKNIWKNTVFVVAYAIVVGLFDWKMHCNYGFLKSPVAGTPLEWLYNTFGAYGYLESLLILVTVVNLITYGFYYVYEMKLISRK